MSRINWKLGDPPGDGVYLTTLELEDAGKWVVLTRFENGVWHTSSEVKAWDFRPVPYDPLNETDELYATSGYTEELEWRVKDLEASWTEVHGEMKYYEGASEALLNVIKLLKEE